ncbi:MAG TPA: hypothetical protein VKU82_03445 [Planctomycetaceae bacterium]|nr:hypothetical protein [Planctomycetaceae bacterium]
MPQTNRLAQSSPAADLARDIVDRIDEVLNDSSTSGQPIELQPHRGRLFELFVMADAAGFLEEGADHDLSCDGIARELAARWNLAENLGGQIAQPSALPPEQLRRLRLLWSFMRMWMEWTYAWQRWEEFHKPAAHSRARVAK